MRDFCIACNTAPHRLTNDFRLADTATCAMALHLHSDPLLSHGGSGVPEWIEVLPPGPQVVGRDGRKWLHDQADQLIVRFKAEGMPLPIDWEHATEFSDAGQLAPAAGWIEDLELQDGTLRAQVEWTAAGAQSVANKEYRFISPVFIFDRETSRIVQLISAALTNRPNLPLRALNREEQLTMDPQLLALLGLAANASMAEVCAAVTALQTRLTTAETERDTALNRANTPDLARFVPRADYDAMQTRATNAEQQLGDMATQARESQIETAISAALEAGKITPATVEYYRASCREDGGLKRFTEFVKAAPTIAADSGLEGRDPATGSSRLTAEQKAICVSLGISEDDYAKSLEQASV